MMYAQQQFYCLVEKIKNNVVSDEFNELSRSGDGELLWS